MIPLKFNKFRVSYNILKYLFILAFFVTVCCKKEDNVLLDKDLKEIINITDYKILSLTDYEINIEINIPHGENIDSAHVVFEDITVLDAEDIVIEISSTKEEQNEHKIKINIPRLSHDYYVTAYLFTSKNLYLSNSITIRSRKNNFEISLVPNVQTLYTSDVLAYVQKGSSFRLKIGCLEKLNSTNTLQIRLNKTIPLVTDYNFNSYISNSSNAPYDLYTYCTSYIPKDINHGKYDVYVYIDSIEIVIDEKIKVLEKEWGVINSSYPGSWDRYSYTWFHVNNELYVIPKRYWIDSKQVVELYKYSIIHNSWEKLKNPEFGDKPGLVLIQESNLVSQKNGYLLVNDNGNVGIWEYQSIADSWVFKTIYPGLGKGLFVTFVYKNNLYIGGGKYGANFQDEAFDFWKYNLSSDEWNRISDLPDDGYIHYGGSICVAENSIFFMSMHFVFWEFTPDTENWLKRAKFPGKETKDPNLTYFDGKILLLGGRIEGVAIDTGTDECWEYSLSDNSWDLNSFLPEKYFSGVAFNYSDKIYAGLGFTGNYNSNHSFFVLESD